VWDVIDAAQTKPFGIMRFDPGPGVGGHCIPLDPFYLAWKAREFDMNVRFIELAGEINWTMPYFVREKVMRALNEQNRSIKGSNILVLGVAYKRDIEDWRESPALKVMDLLAKDGARIDYHDPHVPSFTGEHDRMWHSLPLAKEQLERADAVLILTDHSSIDYAKVCDHAKLVIDTRNATKDCREGRDNVVML
ncbi:MAG: UDP-N-acetyl-D-glucosamine dehydrogenase, partial [Candidatus Eremiobacteraeota bacterium]|nr:UDP-N-acetyl-D-glucosamine dehydrogenase [Candidatus Eremiobacteraeota bacterium]